MSKRTLSLIIVLIAITAVLVTIALSPQKPTQKPQPAVPTPTPVAQTTLSLSPNPLVVSSSSATVDVNIETKENKATAVQLELSFDPKMLTVTDITPASFFEKPLVLFKKINNQDGKISYAIAISPSGTPKKGTGTVAIISLGLNLTIGEQTQITPLPKTMVTASGISPSVLKEALGTTIIFGNSQSGTTGQPLEITGVVRYSGNEGGCWYIEPESPPCKGDACPLLAPANYAPLNLPKDLQKTGLKAKFKLELQPEIATICQLGPAVKILEYQVLK